MRLNLKIKTLDSNKFWINNRALKNIDSVILVHKKMGQITKQSRYASGGGKKLASAEKRIWLCVDVAKILVPNLV